jgi:hypothetical protein
LPGPRKKGLPQKKVLGNFKKTALGVAKVLGRAALHVGVNAGTAGLLDAGAIAAGIEAGATEVAKAFGEETAKAVDDRIKERLESHRADREAFDQFRGALGALVSTLSISNDALEKEGEKRNALPLVFIIDELDRCRPTFSIALLEKIKHFFSVPGLTFVLVTNLSQLEASVRFAYGDIEARTYLEKFYHLRLTFPPINKPTPDSDVAGVYLRYLFSNMLPKSDDPEVTSTLRELISQLARIHALSLRTLERVCAHTGLFLISTEKNYLRPTPIVAGLSVMKAIAPELYQKARSRQLEYKDAEQFFKFDQWREWHEPTKRSRAGEFSENWWRFVLGTLDSEKKRRLEDGLAQYNYRDAGSILNWCCDFIDGVSIPQA